MLATYQRLAKRQE